jgi:hypothetical protein
LTRRCTRRSCLWATPPRHAGRESNGRPDQRGTRRWSRFAGPLSRTNPGRKASFDGHATAEMRGDGSVDEVLSAQTISSTARPMRLASLSLAAGGEGDVMNALAHASPEISKS